MFVDKTKVGNSGTEFHLDGRVRGSQSSVGHRESSAACLTCPKNSTLPSPIQFSKGIKELIVSGEFPTGVSEHQLNSALPPLRVVPLMNVVMIRAKTPLSYVQYAIVMFGEGDEISTEKRHQFSTTEIFWKRHPTGSIDYCFSSRDVDTCGATVANIFCQQRLGNDEIGLKAVAESFGEKVPVQRTFDGEGRECVSKFVEEEGKWHQCFSFASVTCSTFQS
jgi:hypothetical protein